MTAIGGHFFIYYYLKANRLKHLVSLIKLLILCLKRVFFVPLKATMRACLFLRLQAVVLQAVHSASCLLCFELQLPARRLCFCFQAQVFSFSNCPPPIAFRTLANHYNAIIDAKPIDIFGITKYN